MVSLCEILAQQHEGMFNMLDKALSSVPDKPVGEYRPEELTALRLILHSLEAIDNYFSNRTPPNFGTYLLYGVRSSNPLSDFPAYASIREYLLEVKDRTSEYLTALEDDDFLSIDNNWKWELINLFFYVRNHTYSHLGHLDQLLYDTSDPRGWKCWSYNFEKK